MTVQRQENERKITRKVKGRSVTLPVDVALSLVKGLRYEMPYLRGVEVEYERVARMNRKIHEIAVQLQKESQGTPGEFSLLVSLQAWFRG